MQIPRSNDTTDVLKNKISDLSIAKRAYYQKTDFTWDLELFIDSGSPITRIVSFSHNIKIEFIDEDFKRALVTLKNSDRALFSTNFQLCFRNDNVNTQCVLAQNNKDEIALAISFLTDLASEEEVDKRKPISDIGPDLDK